MGRPTSTTLQPGPITPSKKRSTVNNDRAEFDACFLEFSKKYNLNLSLPSSNRSTLSPRETKLKEKSDAEGVIYRRLLIHWRNDTLGYVFDALETAARAIPSRPYNGRGFETQRQQLIGCLVNILETMRPAEVGLNVSSAAPGMLPLASAKRASDGPQPLSKRLQDAQSGRLKQRSLHQYFYQSPVTDFNSSKSTLMSETFDLPDAATTSSSQESAATVEAPSHEGVKYPSLPFDSSPLSPDTQFALRSSFNKCLADRSRPNEASKKPFWTPDIIASAASKVEEKLQNVWPTLPREFDDAPFAIRWEIQRVALALGVQAADLRLGEYDAGWRKQDIFWRQLGECAVLQGNPHMPMPTRSSPEAWNAALAKTYPVKVTETVIFSASLTLTSGKDEPGFRIHLHPLKLDLPHRLDRKFGSDRFLQVTMPAITKPSTSEVARWLVNGCHFLAGRKWAPFYVESAQQKKKRDVLTEPRVYSAGQLRVYLFAEDANEFAMPTRRWSENDNSRCRIQRAELLQWLLRVSENTDQPALKLFQRIKLGLSRTVPTVILQPDQIQLPATDVLSPAGKPMNDGIGRMSRRLAHDIAAAMYLTEQPCGFQGRIGSAKGFWIIDASEFPDEIWIEIYPSQRKWILDFRTADKHQRTFEVRNYVRDLVPARLNLQLLPILEDRAIDQRAMRTQIGDFLRQTLQTELDEQKLAMQDPIQFLSWMHDAGRRRERIQDEQVSFLGGLPKHQGEQMSFLLTSGFDPLESPFLRDLAWKLRSDECQELQTRLNIKIAHSTFAYMIVDFDGLLKENEVHLGFTTKFDHDFPETFLHGFDVLVARTPAHYPSDIQRVRAVFKPELRHLQNAIVFPTKGNSPLADKLSGGDYDGDQAWVCWEPTIVKNFRNADVPEPPDLFGSGILSKDKQKYRELAEEVRVDPIDDVAITAFLMKAFTFNMQPNYLGIFTNFKEKLCYARNSVSDYKAILMSTVLSHLVDRPKQGVIFTEETLSKLQKQCIDKGRRLDQPRYKSDCWTGGKITHIIDYVKFGVGVPTVDRELSTFDAFLKSKNKGVHYDLDLVREYEHRAKSDFYKPIIAKLKIDLERLLQRWQRETSSDKAPWETKVTLLHEAYRNILPQPSPDTDPEVVRLLLQEELRDSGLTDWDLLKASALFKQYYKNHLKFVFWMAGFSLAALKAKYSAKRGAPPTSVTAKMYAGLRPDTRYAKAVAAKHEGRSRALGGGDGWSTSEDDDYDTD